MGKNNPESIVSTDFTNVEYTNLVSGNGDRKDFYTGSVVRQDYPNGMSETTYTTDWALWWGYYIKHPELASAIDTLTSFVVSEVEGEKKELEKLRELIGDGKMTYEDILENQYKVAIIGGDSFAEKIDINSKLVSAMKRLFGRKITWNLKPIGPDNVKVIYNERGLIKGYDLINYEAGKNKVERRISPNKMFHLSHNKIGAEIHGTPIAMKLKEILQFRKEMMDDMRVVFHRYVKPMLLINAKTDDIEECNEIAGKIDNAYKKTENLVIPSESIDNVEQISVAGSSTLDPLPWHQETTRGFTQASRVPEVIGGWGGNISEAGGKIVYLGFEGLVKDEQRKYELQIENQLNIKIKFKAPASLEPNLQADNKKDGGQEVRTQEAGKNQH